MAAKDPLSLISALEEAADTRRWKETSIRNNTNENENSRNAVSGWYQKQSDQIYSAINSKYSKLEASYKSLQDNLYKKAESFVAENQKLRDIYAQNYRFPRDCDVHYLNRLYEMIMTDTKESFLNKTFHKNGYYAQNKMISDFVAYAAKTIRYYSDIAAQIEPERRKELHALLDELEKEKVRKEAEYSQVYETRKADLERSRKAAKTDFYDNPAVCNFRVNMAAANAGLGYAQEEWTSYSPKRTPGTEYGIGSLLRNYGIVDTTILAELKAYAPEYCKEKGYTIPNVFKAQEGLNLFVKYDDRSKEKVYETVQLFILQKLRVNPTNRVNVFFADPNDRGKNLGCLAAPNEANREIGISVENEKDKIVQLLESLVHQIDEITQLCGTDKTVYNYNKNHPNSIKETVLVLCDVENCLPPEKLGLLKTVYKNGAGCGISIIITSRLDGVAELNTFFKTSGEGGWKFLMDVPTVYLTMTQRSCFFVKGRESSDFYPERICGYHRQFLADYRKNYAESIKVDNTFSALRSELTVECENDKERRYGKAFNGIRLPIMIDTAKNTVCRDFVIGTENSMHTLITGGTGSGKSRFLQMIISSIIMNYHPDDVELWLIDCKKVEFKKFLDLRPQHVRMVSLERTQEFTFAFLDYLHEFAQNRTKLFMEADVSNIKDYREKMDDPYCMPRVVIIIDEFHAITANVNLDMKYRQILEDALSEYRNLGISFIFSDQSVSGLKGLTEKGRQQLHNRVAMKNSISEMRETLQLLADNYQPETLSAMEKSEGKGEFWWNRNINAKYRNVFITDEQQEQLIEEIINNGQIAKKDAKVILVNGNERSGYQTESVRPDVKKLSAPDSRELLFTVGVPTTLDEIFSFRILQKYNHNIMIAGRDSHLTIDVMISMIRSVAESGSARVMVFADEMDENIDELRDGLERNRLDENVTFYSDYGDICRQINEYENMIRSKHPLAVKTLVFWLGIGDLYEEFKRFPAKKEDSVKPKNGGFLLSDDSGALNDPQLQAMAESMGISVAEALMFMSDSGDGRAPAEEDEDFCYNAVDDMFRLFELGGKFGLFNVVSFEYSNDMKRLKGFNREHFIHSIAFSMSRDESVEFGFRTAAAELNEGLTALYTDGIKTNTFKPYKNT